jgi:DNA invertase Pin-like site-specific DNA recombinase
MSRQEKDKQKKEKGFFVHNRPSRDMHKKSGKIDYKSSQNVISIIKQMERIDVGYVRVSSREQAEDQNALAQQRCRIENTSVTHIFEDIQPGSKDNRPQFLELMEWVRSGRVRKLFITRIDRITRSLITLRKLIDELEEYDVFLVILDQNLDLSTAQGRMMLNMLGMLAEWEVDLLSERVKNGMAHIRNQQKTYGSSPFGYVVVDHEYRLDTDPFLCLLSDRPDNYQAYAAPELPPELIENLVSTSAAEVARDCIDLLFEHQGFGRAVRAIQAKYGLVRSPGWRNGCDRVLNWTVRGFVVWTLNPVLDGHTAFGKHETVKGKRKAKPMEEWEIIRDTHPEHRLLKDGEFDEILLMRERNKRVSAGGFYRQGTQAASQTGNYKPFAYQIGIVHCGECDSLCTQKSYAVKNKQQYRYYACRHSGVGCSNRKSVRQTDIESALIQRLVEYSQSLNTESQESTEPLQPEKSPRQLELEERLEALEQISGFDPDIEQLKAKVREQIHQEVNPFATGTVEDKTALELIRAGNNLGIWQTLTADEKVLVYQRIVRKIVIRNGQVVNIHFKA